MKPMTAAIVELYQFLRNRTNSFKLEERGCFIQPGFECLVLSGDIQRGRIVCNHQAGKQGTELQKLRIAKFRQINSSNHTN